MVKSLLRIAFAAALLAGTSTAFAAGEPATVGQTSKGPALVDAHGMTLYTFDNDSAGKSACNGNCAVNWPPLMAEAGAAPSGDWTIITRDDGSSQWAYKGQPLYTWKNDKAPGDVTGDGVNEVWHIATP